MSSDRSLLRPAPGMLDVVPGLVTVQAIHHGGVPGLSGDDGEGLAAQLHETAVNARI